MLERYEAAERLLPDDPEVLYFLGATLAESSGAVPDARAEVRIAAGRELTLSQAALFHFNNNFIFTREVPVSCEHTRTLS